MSTTYTVFIFTTNMVKQTDKLVLRKFFLDEKEAKKYFCDLQKVITSKGYIYDGSNKFYDNTYGEVFIKESYYFDSALENELTLEFDEQLLNVYFDENPEKVTLFSDSWGGNNCMPYVWHSIEEGRKAIFEEGKLTFDHFTKA